MKSLDQLLATMDAEAPAIPEDAFTIAEYASRRKTPDGNGISLATAAEQLNRMVRSGLLSTARRSQFTGGQWREVRVFWMASQKATPKAKPKA